MNDRERLIELLDDALAVYDVIVYALLHTDEIADLLISDGVTVQRHGRWIDGAENFTCGNHNAECSACHCNVSWSGCDEDFNYCPNCGAKMDGEADGA